MHYQELCCSCGELRAEALPSITEVLIASRTSAAIPAGLEKELT
jgi:hypothetical protein